MTPEARTRINIDKMLAHAGYVLQDMKEFNRTASLGVAVREFPTKSGPVDYLLFIDGNPVGVIEAKAEDKGVLLGIVAEQSKRYAESGLEYMTVVPNIRFAYESTGIITNYCDYHDQKARSREVFSFHRPETLFDWIEENDTLRNRMKSFPSFNTEGFRDCQVAAILNLEKSMSENKPRALIQMATGAGKTYTAITSVYRLLQHAKAKRVLFLVDTKNLGEQAESEFRNYRPSDSGRSLSELFVIRRLNSGYIPKDTKICISTIQRMYSILRGEEMDESIEETSLNEQKITGKPRDVAYNPNYPPEFFDFIIIDECHRSIYNIWQQVLDYFDAFLIGLTATPDNRTFGFFKQNIVSEYTHEQAVLDDVNVGREGTYFIETQIGTKGSTLLRQTVEKRDRLSRKKRWEQLDEDIDYKPSQLDRDIVNPSHIRTVIRVFKEKKAVLFPGRVELPKTLVFAKTDSHADDIITVIREEFGEGNEFCKKITYSVEDSKSVLAAFRNDFYPRIAVTVDMIATGTDVKPIECLIFMRDVRSKNYYEQMLGRATRTLDYENLHRVSPSAKERKLGYIVIDAVGVTKTQKNTSRQLERKPTVSLKDLLMSVAMGTRDDDTITSLANRLINLDKRMTKKENVEFTEICGESCINVARNLLNAFDEDFINDAAQEKFGIANAEEITDEQYSETSKEMAEIAVTPFNNPKLRDYIENVRKNHDQIIDNVNMDEVTFAGWDSEYAEKADEAIHTFAKFIEENKDTIEALEIIYSQSYRTRPLTLQMIQELYEILQKPPYNLTTEKLWKAYSTKSPEKVKSKNVVNQLVDIISLIRYQLGQSTELRLFADDVNLRFRDWILAKNAGNVHFTEEQTEWLRMIRDHIATSTSISPNDLDYTPFVNKGGLGKFFKLFGSNYENILNEMNTALIAA
ncbi:MAG: DEAD/DEAH box helicase family protein [Defluviitaleaceae bacterium]|nr:DEAD/DEAH box helicase family protein [Defluviitaleaceae bacterium]